jgi:cell division protein FtsN
MAKDYKNTAKRKRKKAKVTPGWVWMLAGLSIGLLVAFLVYLQDHPMEMAKGNNKPAPVVEKSRTVEPVKKSAISEQGTSQQGNSDQAQKPHCDQAQKPHFDFYNLLPEMEVLIPEQEIAAEREKNASGEKVVYDLQVGSFRQFEDADRLRAKLALMNFESHIQRVTITGSYNSEQTWFRVRVGPFKSARKMGKVRNQLRNKAMDPIVLKTVLKPKS